MPRNELPILFFAPDGRFGTSGPARRQSGMPGRRRNPKLRGLPLRLLCLCLVLLGALILRQASTLARRGFINRRQWCALARRSSALHARASRLLRRGQW
ncbi:hypothetical protein MIC97_11360 [Aquamicrobium sp. NLF2-7]|uniref:hypothetical protein n=1 Tax=Aquamicrobium sp. NLF2-7 TaxID=2918753 RepID=UPI001EFB8383|nr:hypothetical protein [Aquamicrobium sp. NLF2-7]MCG8272101.1 hypothetical protein [Aquamicrobium sp. NLF2-7]